MNDQAARYALIIEWSSEDQVYIATAPELPGCRTHGATRAEAVARGEDAITDWLGVARDQGWRVPAPRLFNGWSNLPATPATAASA
jgi:predicted RNase H-like HicB family nuclease